MMIHQNSSKEFSERKFLILVNFLSFDYIIQEYRETCHSTKIDNGHHKLLPGFTLVALYRQVQLDKSNCSVLNE